MPAPGATPIILYHTTTASAQPSTSNLNVGELAINVTDKKVYSKDGGNALITVVGTLGNQEASAAAITGGTINATTIGATTAAAGTFTTATAATGNITTVNATTVDTTNIEVTTLKAKDGTAAGSIADSTGVVTLNSSVLTTTDINGGSIDGTTIGAATAAAATVTVLTANNDSAFNSTGALKLPVGTSGQQPGSPAAGMIRFNSSTVGFEGYNGTAWASVGGGNSTNKGLWENSNTITANYTITTNYNAMSSGPITVDSGVSVTVPSGSRWVIL